jgi:hypothetical protein
LSEHDVGAAAVHLADVVAFKRVYEALGHAIGLWAAHRRMDGLMPKSLASACVSLARKAPPLSLKNSSSIPL